MSGGLAQGFLDDMVAHIDDDTPRLVYADWLEENGRLERAEFIRVQVELARLPAWDAAVVRLRLREEQLLDKYGEEWLAEFPTIEGAKWEGFRRGIVAEVSFASFEAMRATAHLCRAAAPVEAVTVRWPRQRETGDAPPIAELRELSLTGRPNSEQPIARLADSPQLATLHTLTAHGLWDATLALLTASPHLAHLKTLRLPSNYLGNVGIRTLVRAAALRSLEELDLSGRGVSEQYNDDPILRVRGMEVLARWTGLATVRTLKLSGNELGQAGLRTLLQSRHIGALKHLTLRNCRLDAAAANEFASAQAGLQLETLDLGENVLRGLDAVATAPCLRQLKALRVDRCELPGSAAAVLAQARFMDGLRLLEVGHNHFGTPGLAALLNRAPPALHTLGLRDNDLFAKGTALLAESPASDGLLQLDLSRNGLGPAGAAALAEASHLTNLLVLRVQGNRLDAKTATTLADSPLGQRLSVLDLENLPPRAAKPQQPDRS